MRHPVCMQYICLAFIFLYAITMFTPRKLSTNVCFFWSKVICLLGFAISWYCNKIIQCKRLLFFHLLFFSVFCFFFLLFFFVCFHSLLVLILARPGCSISRAVTFPAGPPECIGGHGGTTKFSQNFHFFSLFSIHVFL